MSIIRSTAKAIVIHQEKILLIQCYDTYNGAYFSLPGGGQNQYETLYDAIIRECLEETGYTVHPIRFAALCEEICDHPEFRENYPEYAHKMVHFFVCELQHEDVLAPTEKDDMQTGIEWVEISRLDQIRLLPQPLGENLSKIINSDVPMFLGSEHIAYNHG